MQILKFCFLSLILASITSCSFQELTVASLGSIDNFDDTEIDDDFVPPEDEKEEEIVDEPSPVIPGDTLKNTFFIEQQSFNLAHGPSKRWDGCRQNHKSSGGYNSDLSCGRAFIEDKFGKNLNQIFFKCVFDASNEAKYTNIQKIFINHLGSYNDRTARNSTRLSHHAYARALDIKNFNLIDAKGNNFKISTLLRDYKGQQAIFYDSFRQCWKQSMPSSCKPGNSEHEGSVGHNSSKLGGNTLHNDHIHLSFPLCAG